jgi:hypothetical protein
MKQQLKYFGLGMLAVASIALFMNATVDSTSNYFPFIKAGATQENLALPIQNAYAVKIPESVTFAGETVPVDDPEVRERLDRELTGKCLLAIVNYYFTEKSQPLVANHRKNIKRRKCSGRF